MGLNFASLPLPSPRQDHGSSVTGGTAGGYLYIDSSHPRRPLTSALSRQDHGSSVTGGTAGGYLFIDSSHPRRPGDRARLLSRQLASTQETGPLCFRFWTHMNGRGVGSLRVLRVIGSEEKVLWTLSGQSGNRWYQGQVPVTASEQFKVRNAISDETEGFGLLEGIFPG